MTEQIALSRRAGEWLQDHRTRTVAWLRRARDASGHERENVVLVFKSGLAAWLAWFVAYEVLAAEAAAFAPFSAVWMMQVTIYQSVWQSLRYAAAVGAGVALQAVLGFIIGPDLLTFAVVAVVALAIGRWRALGQQGTQVATAAFFAFSTYLAATTVDDRLSSLGELILLVLIGSAIGVAVNVLVMPPVRYRSAEYGVRRVADELASILADIGPALREDELDTERTEHWRGQAAVVWRAVTQARAGLHTARESRHYNPHRLLPRNREHHGFRGYEAVLDALERVSHQVASLVRALNRSAEAEADREHREFLRRYADCTDAVADLTRLLSEVDESRLAAQMQQFGASLSRAEESRDRLDRSAAQVETSLTGEDGRPYGVLLIEVHRLLEEFQYTTDVLTETLPAPIRPPEP